RALACDPFDPPLALQVLQRPADRLAAEAGHLDQLGIGVKRIARLHRMRRQVLQELIPQRLSRLAWGIGTSDERRHSSSLLSYLFPWYTLFTHRQAIFRTISKDTCVLRRSSGRSDPQAGNRDAHSIAL